MSTVINLFLCLQVAPDTNVINLTTQWLKEEDIECPFDPLRNLVCLFCLLILPFGNFD